ncbi:MAG TPA: MltA domain-containing protein [Kofleriaceae bacterium]|nr:MltA domain-containing protein [Kofleriaceae bacterium]
MNRAVASLALLLGCVGEPGGAREQKQQQQQQQQPAQPAGSAVTAAGSSSGSGSVVTVAAGSGAGSGSAATVAAGSGAGSGSAAAADAGTGAGSAADGAGSPHDTLTLTRVTFAELPGWADDKHAEALGSFLRSCEQIGKLADTAPVGHDGHGGVAKQWRGACAAAAKVKPGDHAAARAMFEAQLTPFSAAGAKGPEGLFTGYCVQELRASRRRGGKYQHPLYARPKDLVMVDLSQFVKDARGRRIWGRIDGKGELVPYHTRQEIRRGVLDGRGLELVYADSPIDALFAHIEGTAKVRLDDGKEIWLGFAGKNGRAFRGVGGVLKAMGAFKPPAVGTMQDIRAWLEANPERFDEIADQSPSYVFFQENPRAGAIGSQMVVLTPRRSLAIDRAFVALGTPIWVDTKAPLPDRPGVAPWRRLVIAQDTGGAILGAVRGDIYWGDDARAADIGGRTGGKGRYWLLLPSGVTK